MSLSPLPPQRRDQQGNGQLNVTSALPMRADSVPTALRSHRLLLLCQSIIKHPSQSSHTIAAVIMSPVSLASSRQWAPLQLLGWECVSTCVWRDKSVTWTHSQSTQEAPSPCSPLSFPPLCSVLLICLNCLVRCNDAPFLFLYSF